MDLTHSVNLTGEVDAAVGYGIKRRVGEGEGINTLAGPCFTVARCARTRVD